MIELRIMSEEDRLKVAAVLIKNGYRVEQSKKLAVGKKTYEYILLATDTKQISLINRDN